MSRATTLLFSPHESARFGLRVYRATVDSLDVEAIARVIDRERADVSILRMPAIDAGRSAGFASHGLTPIVADTQVHYDIELEAGMFRPAADGIVLRPATRGDAAQLEALVHEIFACYVTHYHANPWFAPDEILAGYAEWAIRHLDGDDGSAVALVECDGDVAGFSCWRIDRGRMTAIGVLNGVRPALRGRGIYRRMLHAMLAAFCENGVRRFEIATQVHNIAVQRVWTSSGLALRRASTTVHVNAASGTAG